MNNPAPDMPVVGECSVAECAYNVHRCCHARAITVGDGIHPGCDTFLAASPHSRDIGRHAGVGACKTSACRYNDDYECTADQIAVGHTGQGARCLTYQQRLLPDAPDRPAQRQP